jgi:peptide/nickel transport system substrate-binding protein
VQRIQGTRVVIGIVVAIMLTAAACGSSDDDAADGGTGTATESTVPVDVIIEPDGPPQRGGTLVYALASESDGWDPTEGRWATDGTQVGMAIFDPLSAYDADGDWAPYLAEAFDHNADFTEWTIVLREGVTFQNGQPLDSAAVLKMLEGHRASALTKPTFAVVDSMEVTAPLELTVKMNAPWAAFPVALTGQAGVVPAPEMLDAPDGAGNPVGTGPFSFVSWTPDKELIVERNPNYWQKDADGGQLPYLDRIEFRPIPDDGSRTASIQSGDVDMTHTTEIGSIKKYRELAAAGELQLYQQQGAAEVSFVQMNNDTAPFDDVRARQAAAHALDQQQWVDVITQGVNEAGTSVFRPASKWYFDADYPSYDLDEAKRLVEEYEADKGPFEFSLSVLSTPVSTQQGEFLKSMFEQAGMTVSLNSTEASTFIVNGALGQYQMIQWGQFGSPDPDYEHVWWYSANASPIGQLALNFPRNRDPLVDEALNRARSTDDFETRKEAYIDLQKRLAEDVPYAFLDYPTVVKVAQNDVRDMLQGTLPDGEPSIPMGGPGSFSAVTRLTQTWMVQ